MVLAGNTYLVGGLAALAGAALLAPWLRRLPWIGGLPAAPVRAVVTAAVLGAAALLLHRAQPVPAPSPGTAAAALPDTSFAQAARLMDGGPAASAAAAPQQSAGPMEAAIASLEARLAKGGGSADDWELLAKSFEFLGRPSDAARARAHQLPPVGAATASAAGGVKVSGEVTLGQALSGKAHAGETLFIVAKSVDSPGMPVAVLRTSVGQWPLRFTLDDTLSMMAGRTLSSAGRVTIEARISHSGQPMPASGDLSGSTGAIDPKSAGPLSIRIDTVVP